MNYLADIRGLLQYVPEFRGKTFVIEIDWSSETDAVKAEVLMDLTAIQSIGVNLVLSMNEEQMADFYHYSAELEFRVSSQPKADTDVDGIREIIERGQAAVVVRGAEVLADSIIELSVRLAAAKLILLGVDAACRDRDGDIIKFIHSAELERVGERGLLRQASKACSGGISRVHLLDVSRQGALINELFSVEGVGTMVYTDSYRGIRALKEEDISEMLAMIGRSVRNTHLVPRTYEDVKEFMDSYYVLEVDDHVVGCGALYQYDDACAEIACLYVKQSHEGSGYGVEMVEFLEEKARELKKSWVFALSNRAAGFFKDTLGYTEKGIDVLPASRRQRLLTSGRKSQVFVKQLV